jgi:hypothetical protein
MDLTGRLANVKSTLMLGLCLIEYLGPMLYARKELARAGSATLGVEMTFESISQ